MATTAAKRIKIEEKIEINIKCVLRRIMWKLKVVEIIPPFPFKQKQTMGKTNGADGRTYLPNRQ